MKSTFWRKILFIGDNIYAQFPNLVTLRGSHPRDPVKWIKSLEKYISLRPKYLVYGHGWTLKTEEDCLDVLTNYKNAMKYIHNATLKHMNAGLPLLEIEKIVKLPKELAQHKFLEEGYGKVNLFVRGVWQHYAGMFNGSVLGIDPITSKERFDQNCYLLEDDSKNSGMSTEFTLILKAATLLQSAANEDLTDNNKIKSKAKFSLEIADSVIKHGQEEDAIDVAKELYMKGLFILGKANGDNMAWKNYYISIGLESTTGTKSQFNDEMRHHMFQRMPLEFALNLFCVHLKVSKESSDLEMCSCCIYLTNGKKVTISLVDGFLDFEIDHFPLKGNESIKLVESRVLRTALSHCEINDIDDSNFAKILKMVDFSDSYRRD